MATIKTLENRHWAVVRDRMTALSDAIKGADPATQLSLIERFNVDPYWEGQLDEIAAEIRELDPLHSYLPENNYE